MAEGEVQIAASPEVVWDVLADLSGWPRWNHDVKSMSVEGPFEPGTTFRWKSGSATLRPTLLRGFIPSVLKGYGRKVLRAASTASSGR